jgi:hypothetical protein
MCVIYMAKLGDNVSRALRENRDDGIYYGPSRARLLRWGKNVKGSRILKIWVHLHAGRSPDRHTVLSSD